MISNLDLSKRTILIVDDDPFTAEVLQNMISPSGCVIFVASCDKNFKEYTSNIVFDIIFMDELLPCKNGTELMNAFKKDHPDASTMFVSTTGAIYTLKDLKPFFKAGFDDVLPKPYNEVYLRNILSKVADGGLT